MAATFEQLAAELYRIPPKEFTARRNALAKELREQDRDLADRVAALAKPTAAASATNLFAHDRPDELGDLLDLGAELRDAQQSLSRERMRALTEQAHALVQTVVRDVARTADGAGIPLGDAAAGQVEQTLRAAMADARAADAVRAGLLAKPLEPAGFGDVDISGAVAGTPQHVPPRTRKRAPASDEPARERDRQAKQAAQQAVEQADRALAEAQSALQERQEALDEASAEHAAAQQEVERLRDALQEAQSRVTSSAAATRTARQERDRAAKRVEAARRRTEAARDDLSRQGG